MSEAGVCRGEAVDAIYGGAHRPRVQVFGILQFKKLLLRLSSSSKQEYYWFYV